MACWVYLAHCKDDTIYTGVTLDLERRIHEHNSTAAGAKYTSSRRPVSLAQAWAVDTWSDALRLEHAIRKSSRKFKEELINAPEKIAVLAMRRSLEFKILFREVISMPIVQIELLEGRTVEQKRTLVEKVTQAIIDSLGASPESISIILRDMPKENYAKAGQLAIDKK